jgi:isoleucyl-tRNA synthetase
MTDFRQSYITSQPSYEANVLERFADLQGLGHLNYCQRPVMHQIEEQRIVSDAMVKSVE